MLEPSSDLQIKINIINVAADVVASYPDFWVSGDVNDLPDDMMKIQTLRLQAKHAMMQGTIERSLNDRAWFPYRRIDAFERTLLFVSTHNQILLQYMQLNANLDSAARSYLTNRGSYMSANKLSRPWAERSKKTGKWGRPASWKSYVQARRRADQYTISYPDFISMGLVAMNMRGWRFANTNSASLLASDKLFGGQDGFVDATIARQFIKRYEHEPRRCNEAYFLASEWKNEPLQRTHLRFFACELQRVYEGAAEAKWRAYVKAGHIPPGISFAMALAF